MLKKPRKLLVASLGVAAVSYACTRQRESPPGNLVAPPPPPPSQVVGNLVAPPPPPTETPPIVGNTAVPVVDAGGPPGDAGAKGDAAKPVTRPVTTATAGPTNQPVGNLMPPPPPPSAPKK